MRTHGTFAQVYEAARAYYNGTAEDRPPLDAVVRRENGEWMLESGLEPAGDADFACSLEAFDLYFADSYDDGYKPTDTDVREFLAVMSIPPHPQQETNR
jgi:hypothetical protein